jgi:hypothetical protein
VGGGGEPHDFATESAPADDNARMGQLKSALLARDAQATVADTRNVDLLGAFMDILMPTSLPAIGVFWVVGQYVFGAGEGGSAHVFDADVVSPPGASPVPIETFPDAIPRGMLRAGEAPYVFAVKVHLHIEQPGLYNVLLMLNRVTLDRLPLNISASTLGDDELRRFTEGV